MFSHGIVLHSLRYGDRQIILDIFTEVSGTVSFLVRQPRSGRLGARASVWQPLSLVEVVWNPQAKANLQKPQELTLWHPWRDLPFQPVKAAIGMFLSEFLSYALRSEQENAALFGFVTNSLLWLDEADSRYANFHIVFLLHLSRFLGFMPNVDAWTPGAYFDLQAASFTPTHPAHPFYIEGAEASLVSKFLRMDYRSMRAVGLNGIARRRALELIALFYRLHIPEFPALKSLEVLAEVFAPA